MPSCTRSTPPLLPFAVFRRGGVIRHVMSKFAVFTVTHFWNPMGLYRLHVGIVDSWQFRSSSGRRGSFNGSGSELFRIGSGQRLWEYQQEGSNTTFPPPILLCHPDTLSSLAVQPCHPVLLSNHLRFPFLPSSLCVRSLPFSLAIQPLQSSRAFEPCHPALPFRK